MKEQVERRRGEKKREIVVQVSRASNKKVNEPIHKSLSVILFSLYWGQISPHAIIALLYSVYQKICRYKFFFFFSLAKVKVPQFN